MIEFNAFTKSGKSADKITFSPLDVTATVDVKDKDLVALHGDVCWSFIGKAVLYVYDEIVSPAGNEVNEPPQSDLVTSLLGASIQLPS
jgi:hypothetical protein